MRTSTTALATALLITGCLATPASAQNAAPPAAANEINVSRLPVSLTRLQRQLRTTAEREEREGPSRLRYSVDVFGRAPRVQLLKPEDNLVYGQPSYGAPTHREMMEVVTPREFRSPVMDFSNLMRWIQSRTKSKD